MKAGQGNAGAIAGYVDTDQVVVVRDEAPPEDIYRRFFTSPGNEQPDSVLIGNEQFPVGGLSGSGLRKIRREIERRSGVIGGHAGDLRVQRRRRQHQNAQRLHDCTLRSQIINRPGRSGDPLQFIMIEPVHSAVRTVVDHHVSASAIKMRIHLTLAKGAQGTARQILTSR